MPGAIFSFATTPKYGAFHAWHGYSYEPTGTTLIDLANEGGFIHRFSAGGRSSVQNFVGSEANARFSTTGSGTMNWGPGSTSADCIMDRSGTGTMRFRGSDTGTTNVLNAFTIGHNTSGTPAAGYGTAVALQAQTSTTANTAIGRFLFEWTDATHATRTSKFTVEVVSSGSSVTAAQFDRSAVAGETGLLLWDADNAAIERVTVGAADSGGAGYKVLRIAN